MKLENELKDVSHTQSRACQTKITDASKQEQESCPFVYSTCSTSGCDKGLGEGMDCQEWL